MGLPPPPPSEDDFYQAPSSLPMPAPPEDLYQVPPPPVEGQSGVPDNYIEKGMLSEWNWVNDGDSGHFESFTL